MLARNQTNNKRGAMKNLKSNIILILSIISIIWLILWSVSLLAKEKSYNAELQREINRENWHVSMPDKEY